jgi:uncharacterized DUF497 family protein
VGIEIARFLFDEENEDKLWEHGLTIVDVQEILEAPHIIKQNRKQRRASHLVVGRNGQGRCIAIPVERTHDPLTWRPVTAWPCKDHEEAWCP